MVRQKVGEEQAKFTLFKSIHVVPTPLLRYWFQAFPGAESSWGNFVFKVAPWRLVCLLEIKFPAQGLWRAHSKHNENRMSGVQLQQLDLKQRSKPTEPQPGWVCRGWSPVPGVTQMIQSQRRVQNPCKHSDLWTTMIALQCQGISLKLFFLCFFPFFFI